MFGGFGHVYYLIKTEHNLGQAVIGDNKHELRVACYGLRVASIGVRYAGYAPVECRVASPLLEIEPRYQRQLEIEGRRDKNDDRSRPL